MAPCQSRPGLKAIPIATVSINMFRPYKRSLHNHITVWMLVPLLAYYWGMTINNYEYLDTTALWLLEADNGMSEFHGCLVQVPGREPVACGSYALCVCISREGAAR